MSGDFKVMNQSRGVCLSKKIEDSESTISQTVRQSKGRSFTIIIITIFISKRDKKNTVHKLFFHIYNFFWKLTVTI